MNGRFVEVVVHIKNVLDFIAARYHDFGYDIRFPFQFFTSVFSLCRKLLK